MQYNKQQIIEECKHCLRLYEQKYQHFKQYVIDDDMIMVSDIAPDVEKIIRYIEFFKEILEDLNGNISVQKMFNNALTNAFYATNKNSRLVNLVLMNIIKKAEVKN